MQPTRGNLLHRLRHWWAGRNGGLLPIIFAETAPLDLRIVGRMLLHAALVGVAAGLVGAAFFGALEYVQRLLLEDTAGYAVLRAHGESFAARPGTRHFRPWLLVLLPAVGGLASGLLTRWAPEARGGGGDAMTGVVDPERITRNVGARAGDALVLTKPLGSGLVTTLAPETRGGGGDAMIDAFHHHGGIIRRRVIWIKAFASLFTLGTGGAGGREGPTMQIGGALGSLVARVLRVSTRERRILLVAGVAAGISAVFRTPLGAALLAVEVLYQLPAFFTSTASLRGIAPWSSTPMSRRAITLASA